MDVGERDEMPGDMRNAYHDCLGADSGGEAAASALSDSNKDRLLRSPPPPSPLALERRTVRRVVCVPRLLLPQLQNHV